MVVKTAGRREDVRYSVPKIPVEITSGSSSVCGVVVDMNRFEAWISDCEVKEGDACLSVCLASSYLIDRQVHVEQVGAADGKHWCRVKFHQPLTEQDLVRLGVIPEQSEAMAELLRTDYEEVRREIRDIKNCRTSIFVWTMGALGAAVVSFIVMQSRFQTPTALAATTVLLGVFLVGVLAVTEKVRAINFREGLAAVLGTYIRSNTVPPRYVGWLHLKERFAACDVRKNLEICPKYAACRSLTCVDEGEAVAAHVNSAKPLLPPIMSSFTALSSTVFALVYAITVPLFVYYLEVAIQDLWPKDTWPTEDAPFSAAAGLTLAAVVGAAFSVGSNRYKRALFLIALGLSGGLAFTGKSLAIAGLLAVFVCGLFLGSLGRYLLRQVNDLRTGKFAFETYAYTWHAMLEAAWRSLSTTRRNRCMNLRNGCRKLGGALFAGWSMTRALPWPGVTMKGNSRRRVWKMLLPPSCGAGARWICNVLRGRQSADPVDAALQSGQAGCGCNAWHGAAELGTF